jgi:hypothetical protein
LCALADRGMRVAVEAANQKDTAGPENDGNNRHYAAEVRRRPIITESTGRDASPVIARSSCDEAIQGPRDAAPGLLRCARNDGWELARLFLSVALERTGLAGANKLETVPGLIRPLGVRPNRLRKEDTYH